MVRVAAGEVQDDTPNADPHTSGHLEELQSQGGNLGLRQFGLRKTDTAEMLDEHVSRRSQQQAELIGPKGMATGPIGEESQLLLLDAILHVPAGGVEPVVDPLRRGVQIADHESHVGALQKSLGLDDDSPSPIPRLGGVARLPEPPLLLAGLRKAGFGLGGILSTGH